jgi:hypothetical protein
LENIIKTANVLEIQVNCIYSFSICQIKIGLKVEDSVRRSFSKGDPASKFHKTTALKVADLPPLLLSTLSSKLNFIKNPYKSAFANLTFLSISFILDIEETTLFVFHLL